MKKPAAPKTIKIGSETLEVGTKRPKAAAAPKAAKKPKAARKSSTRATPAKRRASGAGAKVCLAEVAVRGLVNVSNHLAAGLASHGRPHPIHKGRGVLVGEIEGEIYGQKPAKKKPAKKAPKPKATRKPAKKSRAAKVTPAVPPPVAKKAPKPRASKKSKASKKPKKRAAKK